MYLFIFVPNIQRCFVVLLVATIVVPIVAVQLANTNGVAEADGAAKHLLKWL